MGQVASLSITTTNETTSAEFEVTNAAQYNKGVFQVVWSTADVTSYHFKVYGSLDGGTTFGLLHTTTGQAVTGGLLVQDIALVKKMKVSIQAVQTPGVGDTATIYLDEKDD